MALEGLAALSLASNIAQLVEFSIKIGELTRSFRKNCGRLPKDLQRVENLVNDLVPIAERFQRASDTSTNVLLRDQTLVSLLARCVSEAEDFKCLLDSFRTASQTGWSSFISALKTTRNAGKIDKIEKALESYKSTLTLRIAETSMAKAEASMAKQEYICELLNQNKQASSEKAQTTSDALERLDTSINASFRNMENKMHHFSRQSEDIAEVAENAKAEIEKLRADHAAWAREHNALQHRLRSTHLASRPMILQFQAMQRRKVRNTPRRTSTAIVSRTKMSEPNESGSDDEKAAKKKKAIFNINIVIALSVNATPEELMRSLKQLLYTSWMEVTRRITAAVPVIHHISDGEQTPNEESFKTDLRSDATVLLAFLEMHAQDDVLTYDSARSTIFAEAHPSRWNMNLTCACDFYWKGFSQRLLEINAETPSAFPTLQYRSAAPEKTVSQWFVEDAREGSTKAELELPRSKPNLRSKEKDLHADNQGRRRRRRSMKRGEVLVQAIRATCALSAVLFLIGLSCSLHHPKLYCVTESSYLRFPGTKDNVYDGSRSGTRWAVGADPMKGANARQAEANGSVGSTFSLLSATPAYMYTQTSTTAEDPSLILSWLQ